MAERPKIVALTPKPAPPEPWQPIEALREFMGDVASGKITPEHLMIFWVEQREDGRHIPHYWTARCSILEQIGYGELIKQMAMDDWKDT